MPIRIRISMPDINIALLQHFTNLMFSIDDSRDGQPYSSFGSSFEVSVGVTGNIRFRSPKLVNGNPGRINANDVVAIMAKTT